MSLVFYSFKFKNWSRRHMLNETNFVINSYVNGD